jgi:hypothetical protein
MMEEDLELSSDSDSENEDTENCPPINIEIKKPLHILALLNSYSSRVKGLREVADKQNILYEELMRKHKPNARYPFVYEASLPKKYDEEFHQSANKVLTGKDTLTGALVVYNSLVRHVEKVQRQIIKVDNNAPIPVFNKKHKPEIRLSECTGFFDKIEENYLGVTPVATKEYKPSSRVP